MNITEERLKAIIREEVERRRLDELLEEIVSDEICRWIVEQDDDISDEEYLRLWASKPDFRQKVRNIMGHFDSLPSIKKKAAIIALGVLGAAGTEFAGDVTSQSQAKEIAHDLRVSSKQNRDDVLGTAADWSSFRNAAQTSAIEQGSFIKPDNTEGIAKAKRLFMYYGVEEAPIIADGAIAMSTGEQQ